MHFDLNFPVTASASTSQPKKNKNKQPQQSPSTAFTPAQVKGIEARLDLLEHCLFIPRYVKQMLIASQ
jgi:ribonuclease P/MRP protein subunit RPP1